MEELYWKQTIVTINNFAPNLSPWRVNSFRLGQSKDDVTQDYLKIIFEATNVPQNFDANNMRFDALQTVPCTFAIK